MKLGLLSNEDGKPERWLRIGAGKVERNVVVLGAEIAGYGASNDTMCIDLRWGRDQEGTHCRHESWYLNGEKGESVVCHVQIVDVKLNNYRIRLEFNGTA